MKQIKKMIKKILVSSLIGIVLFITIPYKPLYAQTLDYQSIGDKLTSWANKYNIPPVVLKAIAWQESNWRQYDASGQPLIGYDHIGIGIMQISDYTPTDTAEIDKLKTDIDYNIEQGCQILNQKWRAYPKIGYGDRNVIENWYFAVWGYNGWTASNNPNNPFGKGDKAYPEVVFNLMGQQYNSAITFVPGATKIPRSNLPQLNPPGLSSTWNTPNPVHPGDLTVDLPNLISNGGLNSGLNGDASGDYWLNASWTKYNAVGSYYSLSFYVTAYNRSTGNDKAALSQKILSAYQNLLLIADQKVNSSLDSDVAMAGKYYWTVMQGPNLDGNIAARARDGFVKTRISRIYGTEAQDTAIAISQEGWSSSPYVLLARVDQFQDALAAAPLAKKLNAPLLLTQPDQLDSKVLEEIKRLGAQKVYIIGGEGALKSPVFDTLSAAGRAPERIYGQEAADTASEIARRIGKSSQVIIASSTSFPDALSASAPAAAQGIPILLTDKNSVPASTMQVLKDFGVTKTIIVGGSAVISTSLDDNGGSLHGFGPMRLAGNTQYDTMLEIVKYFKQDPSKVIITTGENFPDGLTGGAYAALTGSPILLVGKSNVDSNTQSYLTQIQGQNAKINILGGPGAITTGSETMITNAISN